MPAAARSGSTTCSRTDLPELVRICAGGCTAHPELGRRESATSALILRTLDADGIKAKLMPTGTGVIAEVGTGEQVVGLRADIDALPIDEVDRPAASPPPCPTSSTPAATMCT